MEEDDRFEERSPADKTVWEIKFSSLMFGTFKEAQEQAMKLWPVLQAQVPNTQAGLKLAPELGHFISGKNASADHYLES